MNKSEAVIFLMKHSNWLSENWNMSPEGREYKKKFDEAVNVFVQDITKLKEYRKNKEND